MINYISQFDTYKDRIPEFIIKLYHILELRQFNDYMCWNGDHEIMIKNSKKLEEKVLPQFFRHRHLSSFVRQLNMYKFSKVNKLTKEKNQMYFKNQHFRRGQIQLMTNIKRNTKKQKNEVKIEDTPQRFSEDQQSEVSINKQMEENALTNYKQYVRNSVKQISQNLKKIQAHFPQTKLQMDPVINMCNELLEGENTPMNQPVNQSMNIDDTIQNKNMLSTMKLLPRLESLIFPSQCSFYHFNS